MLYFAIALGVAAALLVVALRCARRGAAPKAVVSVGIAVLVVAAEWRRSAGDPDR